MHYYYYYLNFISLKNCLNFKGLKDEIMTSTSLEFRRIFEFIIELGNINEFIRLRAESVTVGYASIYCHRVLGQKGFPADQICPYTMAAACMLVAGKVSNDARVNTRDVMNLSYSILHPDAPPLEIGDLSYALREGLIEMELVALRFLRFRLNFEHPHQDLILMLRLLRDWYPNVMARHPGNAVDRVCAMFLQDLYVHPQIVLDHKPKTLAATIISMAFTALRLHNIAEAEWLPVFMPRYDARHLERIRRKIVESVYGLKLPSKEAEDAARDRIEQR